jgi:hypothetical protein
MQRPIAEEYFRFVEYFRPVVVLTPRPSLVTNESGSAAKAVRFTTNDDFEFPIAPTRVYDRKLHAGGRVTLAWMGLLGPTTTLASVLMQAIDVSDHAFSSRMSVVLRARAGRPMVHSSLPDHRW